MPRSSRHKSSKHSHSSRDYSETEKEVGVKEKKGREDGGGSSSSSRHLKDLSSGEKRKLESKSIDISKDAVSIGNAEYNDEFVGGLVSSSSKKRKEKIDDDRWTGEDNEHELSKSEMKEKEKEKEKEREREREVRGSGDSKRSSRRETSYVSGFDVEEGKRSGSKGEGKHHRSERKERGEKDGGLDRERKGSRSDKSEKLVDIVSVSENTGSEGNRKQSGLGEERSGKHGVGNTDFIQEELKNAEPEKDLDRRVRRKRDTSGDEDRHHDAVRDPDDRRLSSREEIVKSGKYKDDGHKDERNRDRFQEDLDKELWRQDEKQRDNRGSRDYTSGKSDDKHLRNDKKDLDVSHKKSKSHGGEPDRELDRERERDRDRGRDHDRDRGRDHDRDRGRDHDRDRGRDRDRDGSRVDHDRDREHDDREHDFDRERDRDLERVHDRDRDRDIERVHDRDRELDRDRDRGRDRYRRDIRDRVGVRDHDRGRDRDFDHDHDYASHNGEKGSRYKDDRGRRRSPDGYDDYHGDKLRRVENEMDKERSLSRKPNVDSVTSSSRHKASPSSRAYVGADKYRDAIQDETKYGDSLRESTLPEALEKAPKYRSGEKRAKFDDNHGEFAERSPKTKVSPAGLKERSPSSTSFDRSRFSSRNARRRSLDVDDAERRSSGSNDLRDNMGMTEDRQGRDLPSKKSLGDEYPPTESPYYHKSGQGSASSHGPGPSAFRNRAESPSFAGSFGEDNRGPGRYRRSVDPNVARGPGLGPGNAWKGIPNWPSPITNGFMPFPPPGPHIGGFPPMLSQFPPLFGVRPALDMNHQGMPYHMADGDRFPGHLRPMGWPNMVEGPMPPHFHQWDGGNGILRDDSSMYGPGHLAQRRDMNSDIWKQNGDVNMDVTSGSQKDGPIVKASTDEASSAHGGSKPNVENSCLDDQATSFKKDASSGLSAMKEMPLTPAKGTTDKTPESTGVDDTAQLLRAYLAKLDISMDLADPELYNQCISLGIKGDSEFVEDEVEPEFMEEKTVVGPEIMNFTMDVKIFPAAKESIFQRAMNLYKTQSCERNNGVPPDDDKICCPSPCQPEVELNLILEEEIDCPADLSVEQEEQTLVLAEDIVPTTGEGEREELNDVSITGDEVHSGDSAAPLQSSDLTLDVGDDTQLPVLDAEKMEEEPSLELIPENADKGHLSVESTYPDSIVSTADENAVDGGKIISSELAPGEQLDAPVSGPLSLSTDSVKVCEALISVSNESESVVLSRIHHAPESTH